MAEFTYFMDILKTSYDVIAVVDSDASIIYANEAKSRGDLYYRLNSWPGNVKELKIS